MNSTKLYSNIANKRITKASNAIENPSTLEILSTIMVEGEHSPCYCPKTNEALRDPDTNNLILLEYTPEILKAYYDNFSKDNSINWNINHRDGTYAGKVTDVNLTTIDGKAALTAKGLIEDPIWISKLKENNFSGISIETFTNLENISESRLTAVSLLDILPPACGKELCSTKILTASTSMIQGDIFVSIDNSDLIFTEEEQEFLDNFGFDTKASWNGPANEKKLLDYSRDKNGNIVISKIRKYFLVVNGPSGEQGQYTREDLKYPVGSIINGKPDFVLDGLVAALKRSAGEGLDLKSKIRRIIIRRFGLDMLPPSLKTKATMLLLENDLGDKMDIIEEKTQTESPPVVETKAAEVEIPKEEPKIEVPVVATQASATEVPKEEPKIEALIVETQAAIIEVPKEELKPKVVLTKSQMDEVAIAMGAETFEIAKDMITELADLKSRVNDKAGQWQADDLQKQIDCLRKENEDLKAFKNATEEKEIMEVLPKGVWQGELEVDGVLVPKIKLIADEIRHGGVAIMLKYVKGAASGSVVEGKASEEEVKAEIKTKGSLESVEIEDETANKQEQVIQAVKNFTKRYMKS
jgi:hypothetical protein